MSLFSVCLHFLRCRRSCEKKAGYCNVCSRVRENTFYQYNAFLSLKVSHTDDYLNISSSEQIDLDVFLNEPAYFPVIFLNQLVSVQILKYLVLLEIYLPFALFL